VSLSEAFSSCGWPLARNPREGLTIPYLCGRAKPGDDDVSEKLQLDAVRVDRSFSTLARWRAERSRAATFMRLGDAPGDRRGEKRRTARLKWGKALDCADRFLCECVLNNRTSEGACLRLARNITIPQRFQLYEDDSGEIYEAQVVWRRGGEIGCRLAPAPTENKPRVAQRMRGQYYAMD
jgi:hypothetical protein